MRRGDIADKSLFTNRMLYRYYEWHTHDNGKKQPYFITAEDRTKNPGKSEAKVEVKTEEDSDKDLDKSQEVQVKEEPKDDMGKISVGLENQKQLGCKRLWGDSNESRKYFLFLRRPASFVGNGRNIRHVASTRCECAHRQQIKDGITSQRALITFGVFRNITSGFSFCREMPRCIPTR